MRIKIILLLQVCFLLAGLTMPVVACPPPDCDDCETWDPETETCDPDCSSGQCCQDDSCVDTCSGCYKCLDGSCEPCKCWDDGNPITGSINVQNAKLCEEVTHTSSISDTDHWFKGGNGGEGCEGSPSDTIDSYSWSKIAGDNPETGTFIGATDEATVTWRAPQCTGTVTIKLNADDKPNPMDNPCPDSDRDDPNKVFEGTSTVSLPSGCEYAGEHDSNVHWINPNDDFNSTTCTVFGDFYRPDATYNVNFKYEGCQWACEVNDVEAETRIRVRDPNSLLPGKVSISQASDVPCADANLAKSDLNDPNLNDDVGADLSKYWIYSAIVAHEQKHRTDWQTFYGDELANAVSYAESQSVSIDCDDPNTITCGSAKSSKIADINDRFNKAYQDAYKQYDLPGTSLKEHEQRAYLVENAIEQPVSDALPGGCTP